MKKPLFILLIIVNMLFLSSCYEQKNIAIDSTDAKQTEYTNPDSITEDNPESANPSSKARLVVNGVDITEGNHVSINREEKNAELPILAILRELGHDTSIRYNSTSDIYEAVINGDCVLFSTERDDFSIPPAPGSQSCVRLFTEDEFIVDSKCIYTLLYWGWDAEIAVDYDELTVYVFSVDPYAEAESSPSPPPDFEKWH